MSPKKRSEVRSDRKSAMLGTVAGWTMKLLAHQLIELEIVDKISPETVRQTLKKMNLNLG